MAEPILEVRNLKQHFQVNSKFTVKALDGISFTIEDGEIFALVGESGSGKSTAAKTIMGVYPPTDGEIFFHGRDITDGKGRRENKDLLHKKLSIIFQDSAAALNQRMTVEKIIGEPLQIHHVYKDKKALNERIDELLQLVGLNETYRKKYPSELSGGQRQRVAIARSISMQPELVIADEPIAALDVSIQAQIINLFKHLQAEHRFSFLLIAHDLSIVRFISDRVGVLYHGKLVELGKTKQIFETPCHPYTKSLLSAVPKPDPLGERNKKLVEFDAASFTGEGEIQEVAPGHFILTSP